MKIFNGSKWNPISEPVKDTGWRDISSSLDSSKLGGSSCLCRYRRVENEVTLIFDVLTTSSNLVNTRELISTSSNNVLRKIGLPKGTAKSEERVRQAEDEYSDAYMESSWVNVSGKDLNVAPEREAEMYWKATASTSQVSYMSPARYMIFWVTFDEFPTTIPGTATTL